MKFSFPVGMCLFLFLMVSCFDSPKTTKIDFGSDAETVEVNNNDSFIITSEPAGYKCEKDCERGKIYDLEGICPVCEQPLKSIKT